MNPKKWSNLLFYIIISTLFTALAGFQAVKNTQAQTITPCQSDIDESGIVDMNDYNTLVADFLLTNPTNPRSDINSDGIADITDYSYLARDFGQSCIPPTPTPTSQPTSSPSPSPTPSGNTYYISPNGNNNNPGTQSQPFATFDHLDDNILQPGDELLVLAGTYNQRFKFDNSGTANNPIIIKSASGQRDVILNFANTNSQNGLINGSFITIENIEFINGLDAPCVNINGNNVQLKNLDVHECEDHGINISSQNVLVENSLIHRTSLSHEDKTGNSGWPSGLKVRIGGNNAILQNNTVFNNYGEGIAVTRGINAIVRDNLIYDNFAVQIYIDNSYDVIVERNFAYCSANSGFEYLDGSRPAGIVVGEEAYSGWGAQLKNVTFRNNLVGFCRLGFGYYPEVSGAGLDNIKVIHNTFWGITHRGLYLSDSTTKPGSPDSEFANNIFQVDDNGVSWIGMLGDPNGHNIHHNLFSGRNTDWLNIYDPNDPKGNLLYSNPSDVGMAVNPTYDPTTYRLGASSPAINAGDPGATYPTDYENKSRDSNPDMGAIEFD